MAENIEQKIAFNEVRELLHEHCISTLGHSKVDAMTFESSPSSVHELHQQLREYQLVTSQLAQLPDSNFYDLRETIQRIRIEGTHLEEEELWQLYLSLSSIHDWVEIARQPITTSSENSNESDKVRNDISGDKNRTKQIDGSSWGGALSRLADGVFTFHTITKRIEQTVDKYGHIKDEASAELATIRRELRKHEGSVSRTLNNILRSAKSEGLIEADVTPTLRDGRLVIPVAPAMKRRLRGIVHDESASGKTVFIEPAEVVEANNHIRELEADERRELIRILRDITNLLRPNIKELIRAYAFLAEIEFLRVKDQFAKRIHGISPQIFNKPLIDWTLACHPLLAIKLAAQGKKVVPLDIALSGQKRILLISGPNAGGKSVCLKTVGLLQYMLQCGLPVPMGENSKTGIFNRIFIDIGDEQSIDDDLSTYSSHLLNMKNMMRQCHNSTLLLIDEFGGGTEPTIGGAIAQTILSRFVQRGTFGVITTHYQNLKHYAEDTPGLINGAMLYDRQRMEALFQLQIGHPGSSFAVEIARKIGIPEDIIAEATQLVGQEYVNADKYLLDITRDKRYWEGKRQTIHSQEKQMEQTIERYEKEIAELRAERKQIIRDAKKKAEEIIQESNALVENTIREIKHAQAEKERTRDARQQIEEYRQQLAREKHERDEQIERKMRQIEQRRQRQAEHKKVKASEQQSQADALAKAKEKQAAGELRPIQKDDLVRLKGQQTVGTVQSVQGKKATVAFGQLLTTVDSSKLIHATDVKPQKQTVSVISRQTQNEIHEKQLEFQQDIDVRGMRGDEALQTVIHFIDDALLVNATRVRILHGTGTGALRQLIRQYLSTVPGVKSARDEHVQFGGTGITVVDL